MAKINLDGNPINTLGTLPTVGSPAPSFELVKTDLASVRSEDYKGQNLILNIFPSIGTGVCSLSVKKFNERAAELKDTKVLCISKDLPFAHKRFNQEEGISNIESLSDFRDGSFGKNYNLEITDGPFQGLHSRAVVVINKEGQVVYSEQVPDITLEPNYDAALNSLK